MPRGTESKKLQTCLGVINRIEEGKEDFPEEYLREAIHDAHIAHEQREVIFRLVDNFKILGYHDLECVKAAAPFLED